MNWEFTTANRIHFLRDSVDATQIPGHLKGLRTLFSSFHHLNPEEARLLLQDSAKKRQVIGIFEASARHSLSCLLYCSFLSAFA
jgi:hypothetical protein